MSAGRPLTAGETRLAQHVFGGNVSYRTVKIHKGRYIFFQPDDTAMTPNGEMYFPDPVYKEDFSIVKGDAAWFIHEMTHIWQHQHGVWLRTRRVFEWDYRYGSIRLHPPFHAFNVEQQAAMVEDYFRLRQGMVLRNGRGTLADYRAVIPFLS